MTSKAPRDLACAQLPVQSGHGLPETHSVCYYLGGFRSTSRSQERDQEAHPKKSANIPSPGDRALVPLKSPSGAESVLSLPPQVCTWHNTPLCNWAANQSHVTAASTSPLKYTVPTVKVKDRKEMSTEEVLHKEANLLLHFSSEALLHQVLQDFQ